MKLLLQKAEDQQCCVYNLDSRVYGLIIWNANVLRHKLPVWLVAGGGDNAELLHLFSASFAYFIDLLNAVVQLRWPCHRICLYALLFYYILITMCSSKGVTELKYVTSAILDVVILVFCS